MSGPSSEPWNQAAKELDPMTAVTRTPKRRKPAHGVCRLTLTINRTTYNVRPIPTDRDAALKAYRLKKNDGTAYHVAQTVHGLTCDCPDFVFSRDDIDPNGCKHVKPMVACGLLERSAR
jgi:hypothetical protein